MSAADGFTMVSGSRDCGYRWFRPRWRCDVCDRTGYGSSEAPFEWARSCRNGHSPCPYCGRQLALRLDGTPRVHARCPQRPDDAELLRMLVDEAKREGRRGVRGPLDRHALALLDRLTGGAA